MHDSEQRFRKNFDEARQGIVINSPSFKFINANPAFCYMVGYTENELQTMTFADITHPDYIKKDIENVNKIALGELRFYKTEKRYIKKNGDFIWVEITVSCVRNKNGELAYFIALISDINDRKQNEEKIKKLLNEKDFILKEVHHRIKNNMNTIYSLLKLQAGSLNEPSAVNALNDAAGRVHSMQILYDKLYQSYGEASISARDYLSPLVDEVIANFPNARSLKIEKNIDNLVLNEKILQSVGIIINELLTNVMKYAFDSYESNNDFIKVSALIKGEYFSVIVEDNGKGMPDSVDFENSTGFGLKLIGLLVKQIDGSIRIERGDGGSARRGTKFILEFVFNRYQ